MLPLQCCLQNKTSSGAGGTGGHPGADTSPPVGPRAVDGHEGQIRGGSTAFETGSDFSKVEAGWTAHKIAFLVPSSQRNFSIRFQVLPALVAALFSLSVLLANTVLSQNSQLRGQKPISIPFSIFIQLFKVHPCTH